LTTLKLATPILFAPECYKKHSTKQTVLECERGAKKLLMVADTYDTNALTRGRGLLGGVLRRKKRGRDVQRLLSGVWMTARLVLLLLLISM
jgi:hypothetical protein